GDEFDRAFVLRLGFSESVDRWSRPKPHVSNTHRHCLPRQQSHEDRADEYSPATPFHSAKLTWHAPNCDGRIQQPLSSLTYRCTCEPGSSIWIRWHAWRYARTQRSTNAADDGAAATVHVAASIFRPRQLGPGTASRQPARRP